MTSTIPLQSSDIDTSSSIAIYPREVAYSQSTVSSTIYNGDEDPGVSVREWDNILPYTIPLDFIINSVGENCSFDNRRLYAARNHAPPEQHLIGWQHNFTDLIPQDKLAIGLADILLWWEMVDPTSGESEVHVIRAVVSYWGLIVAFRCASQSPTFSLNGSQLEPTVRQYPFPFTPYYKMNRGDCKEIPIHDDAFVALTAAVDSGSTVCFSHSERGIIMHRPDFINLLLSHIEGLQVISYFKYANQTMVLRAKGERKDGHWPDDEELFRAEYQRMDDMEVLWLKSDLARVRP
jgi:hypothetical protein